MKLSRKLILLTSTLIAVSTIGFAVWSSFFSGITGLAVYSEQGGSITYTSFLDSNVIDVTDNAATVTDYVEVLDNDGATDFTVLSNIVKEDISDGCIDYIDDVDVTVTPTSFSLSNGVKQNVTVTYNVSRWSCPQNITVELNITGIPV